MPAAGQQLERMAKLVGEDEPLAVHYHGCTGYCGSSAGTLMRCTDSSPGPPVAPAAPCVRSPSAGLVAVPAWVGNTPGGVMGLRVGARNDGRQMRPLMANCSR